MLTHHSADAHARPRFFGSVVFSVAVFLAVVAGARSASAQAAPTVSITTPTANSVVAGPLIIAANATAGSADPTVKFYVDSILRDTDYMPPNSFTLNTTLYRNGTYSLLATATDAAGNTGTSAAVSVTFKNILTIPSIPNITGTTLSSITFTWSPSLEGTGKAVAYTVYRNGAEIATTTSLSFTDSGLAAGTTYRYYVMGYDGGGNTSPTSGSVYATTQSTGAKLGMAVGETLLGLDSGTLSAKLDTITALGASWLRFDIAWDHVQPTDNGKYNWSFIDPFVLAAKARGINLLATLGYAPSWAAAAACNATGQKCPPADPATFAIFVKAAVAHYAPMGITDWEIWNEPNLGSEWGGQANAGAYTSLLKSAYAAVKSQSSAAFVLTGGMSPAASTDGNISPISFLTQIYADGGGSSFNAVGMHPYSFPAMPSMYETWNAWSQMASTNPSLRSVMIANGDTAKQIWSTEYGAPTNGPGPVESIVNDTQFIGNPHVVTEAVQAAMLSDAITSIGKDPWAGPLFWYSYKDLGTDPDTVENFFGLVRYDGSTKPAYTALMNMHL